MFPLNYEDVYATPAVKTPEDCELTLDTDFPNLNSRDYARQPLNHTNRMYAAWECIDRSVICGDNIENVVICCNKNSGRDFKSSAWGFTLSALIEAGLNGEKNPAKAENAVFKLQCDSLITHLLYVSPNNFLLALNSGMLQLWSTYISNNSEKRNNYCLFRNEERGQEGRLISAMCRCPSNPLKAITGSKNGTLKIWSVSENDLNLEQSYRFAHLDDITGVAAQLTTDTIFTTCSLDKSCLLWDQRQTRPAIALIESHEVRFKEITWPSLVDNEHIIYVGDEVGCILTLDKRMPKQCLHKQRYFDCAIRKINIQGKNLAVIADSNTVKVSRIKMNGDGNNDIFYTGSKSKHMLRDCIWLQQDLLGVVGFGGNLHIHKIPQALENNMSEMKLKS